MFFGLKKKDDNLGQCLIFTCTDVLEKKSKALYAYRDINNNWSIMCNCCAKTGNIDNIRVAAFSDLLNIDKDIIYMLNTMLNPGEFISLDEETNEWVKYKITDKENEKENDDFRLKIIDCNKERNNGQNRSDFSGIKIYPELGVKLANFLNKE